MIEAFIILLSLYLFVGFWFVVVMWGTELGQATGWHMPEMNIEFLKTIGVALLLTTFIWAGWPYIVIDKFLNNF